MGFIVMENVEIYTIDNLRRCTMYSFTHLLAFFMFYAVVGWCTEVIYKTTCTGHFVNRGFLNGPLCPIYGVGATIVILCLTPLQDNLLVLYIGSVILTSALEFITGLVLEKIFHQKWWDYADEKFNIMGYVCLRFSLLWGVACVMVMKVIQPLVLLVFNKTPLMLKNIIFFVFYGLMAADLIITVIALVKVGLQLKLANDLDRMLNKIAEAVGTRLSKGTLKSMEEIAETKEKLEDLQEDAKEKFEDLQEETREKFRDLQEETKERFNILEARYKGFMDKAKSKYGETFSGTERLSFVHKRLEKAYPSLDFSRLGTGSMSEKIDKIKALFDEITENIGNMKM